VPAAPALLLAPLSLHDALPISIVGNRKLLFLAPGIELVLASGGANFSWNHCEPHEMIWYLPYEIGLVMLTSLRPSGKVASIWISVSISGTPSMTSARPSTLRPSLISSATLRPSRARSTIQQEI